MKTQPERSKAARFSRALRATLIIASLGLVGGLVLALATPPPPASAVDTGTLGIRPSNESDFFHLSVVSGGSVAATAIVTNHLSAPVSLTTYAVDGLTSPGGAFALSSQTAVATSVGKWSHLATGQITVPAHGELAVPFTIAIPTGTAPGDYAGGLMIQSAPVVGETTQSSNTSVRVNVVQRQGVRIYLTVPGATTMKLSAAPLSWSVAGDKVALRLTVTNNGNSTLHPRATVLVDRWFNQKMTLHFNSPESVPPGATVTMTTHYAAEPWAQIATAQTEIFSAAGTHSDVIHIFSVSGTVATVAIIIMLLIALAVWRVIRFVRRARRALAKVSAKHRAAPHTPLDTASLPV